MHSLATVHRWHCDTKLLMSTYTIQRLEPILDRISQRLGLIQPGACDQTLYLGRQYTATYLTRAIDPFKNQQSGDTQRVYGYGLGKVEPLSRTATRSLSTPTMKVFYARLGYKAGESAGSSQANSSKYVGLVYDAGPLQLLGTWQSSNRLSLGAADTQIGAIVASTGLGPRLRSRAISLLVPC
jgi:hypothetical protein